MREPSSFNSIEWILLDVLAQPPTPRLLSIPLNGFSPEPAPNLVAGHYPFNSIEWIPLRLALWMRILCPLSFNSIEWIHLLLSRSARTSTTCLSIPLNGFGALLPPRPAGALAPFNSIEWIPAMIVLAQLSWLLHYLSIPLNGFAQTRRSDKGYEESLSIPLNGFVAGSELEVRAEDGSFQFH